MPPAPHSKSPHLDPPPPNRPSWSPPPKPLLDPPPPMPPPQGGLRPTVSWGGSWRPEPRGRPPRAPIQLHPPHHSICHNTPSIPCHSILHQSIPHLSVPCHSVPCYSMPHQSIPRHSIPGHPTPAFTSHWQQHAVLTLVRSTQSHATKPLIYAGTDFMPLWTPRCPPPNFHVWQRHTYVTT